MISLGTGASLTARTLSWLGEFLLHQLYDPDILLAFDQIDIFLHADIFQHLVVYAVLSLLAHNALSSNVGAEMRISSK